MSVQERSILDGEVSWNSTLAYPFVQLPDCYSVTPSTGWRDPRSRAAPPGIKVTYKHPFHIPPPTPTPRHSLGSAMPYTLTLVMPLVLGSDSPLTTATPPSGLSFLALLVFFFFFLFGGKFQHEKPWIYFFKVNNLHLKMLWHLSVLAPVTFWILTLFLLIILSYIYLSFW